LDLKKKYNTQLLLPARNTTHWQKETQPESKRMKKDIRSK
jgi:hypothetical protein